MDSNRRKFLQQTGAGIATLGLGSLSVPAFAAKGATTKVRLGYLHTIAVDGQLWIGQHFGFFKKHGVEFELHRFVTGLELFQAMIGGSIDMLTTGAVISNFPARGQGKMFLVNDIEYATAQLWVHTNAGIHSLKDLVGKTIATTTGTTAHVFLDTALRKNGIDPSSVKVVNQRMSDAVASFISGAVPAVALWVPFNITVREKVKDAKMLIDASSFYPDAAIVDGWAAGNDYFEKNKPILKKIILGWAEANDYMVNHTDKALELIQKNWYSEVPLKDLKEMYKDEKVFTSKEWCKYYADGTVTKWLNQVSDFFIKFAKIQNAVHADQYFDPKIYLETIKECA